MDLRIRPRALLGSFPFSGAAGLLALGAAFCSRAPEALAQNRPATAAEQEPPARETPEKPALGRPAPPPAESNPMFELRVREWFCSLRGHVGSDTLAPGETMDLVKDLDVDPQAALTVPEVDAELWGYGRLSASGWWSSFKGETTFDTAPVTTRMQLDLYSLTYETPTLSLAFDAERRVDLGLLAGARYMTVHWRVSTPDGEDREGGNGPTPVFGARAELAIAAWAKAELEVLGFTYSDSRLSMGFLEAQAEVLAEPWKGVLLGVGYKFTSLRAHGSDGPTDFRFDANLRGVFISIGARF